MGLLQCLLILCLTLMSSPPSAVSFPQPQEAWYNLSNKRCKMCPAGEYQKSCSECASCPAGTYTARPNQEDACRRCSGDCRPNFHLKAIQMCTNTSDVKCVCEEGYSCTDMVPYSENCRYCRKIQKESVAAVHDKPEHTPPTPHSGRNRAAGGLCNFSTCGPQSMLAPKNGTHSQNDKMKGLLPATVACLFGGVCLALLVLVYFSSSPKISCFKNALASLVCSKGGRAPAQSKESTHQFSRDSFGVKQQLPSPLPGAHLGLVHVLNRGTIIFSSRSQFTGQVGPTIEGASAAEAEGGDDRGCPVFQPAPSPGVHTSEEERSRETDRIFFPSQEQGKDYHVSKEEVP